MAKDRPRSRTSLSHHWLIVGLVLGIACFGAYRDDIARSHRSTRATRGARLDCDHAHLHGDGTVDFGYSHDEPLAPGPVSVVVTPPAFSAFVSAPDQAGWQPAPSTPAHPVRGPPATSQL